MSAFSDNPAVCACVRAGEPFIGKQGFSYAPAISAETVGASAIQYQLGMIPPGARAKAHKHQSHETALHVLSGEVGMWYGERLESQHGQPRRRFRVYPRQRSASAL